MVLVLVLLFLTSNIHLVKIPFLKNSCDVSESRPNLQIPVVAPVRFQRGYVELFKVQHDSLEVLLVLHAVDEVAAHHVDLRSNWIR